MDVPDPSISTPSASQGQNEPSPAVRGRWASHGLPSRLLRRRQRPALPQVASRGSSGPLTLIQSPQVPEVKIHFPTQGTPLDRAIRAYAQVHTYILRLAKTYPSKLRTWNREYFHSLKSHAIDTLACAMQAAGNPDQLLAQYLEQLYRKYGPAPCFNAIYLQVPKRGDRMKDRIAATASSKVERASVGNPPTLSQYQDTISTEQPINPFQDCLYEREIQWSSIFRPAREMMQAAKERLEVRDGTGVEV